MLLNRFETLAMNNPIRTAIQRHFEGRRLFEMGGAMNGGVALEVGCGRGVGAEIILDRFGADRVEALDLDPRMARLANRRLVTRGNAVRVAVGDATQIAAPDGRYDAAFDFGILHHIPIWRDALREIYRVLKPGGRFYAEEVLEHALENRLLAHLFEHPREDRFDLARFRDALASQGFRIVETRTLGRDFAFFVADKPGPRDD
ncbi:MAG: class I SAM-dependent methyltransferase [bacterium]|nr:class I SAM-dependent methyltransferase [bacterium]